MRSLQNKCPRGLNRCKDEIGDRETVSNAKKSTIYGYSGLRAQYSKWNVLDNSIGVVITITKREDQ